MRIIESLVFNRHYLDSQKNSGMDTMYYNMESIKIDQHYMEGIDRSGTNK